VSGAPIDTIITAGVDFASQASNTAACCISWSTSSAVVKCLRASCDDDYLLKLASRVSKLGIDVPLGWPSPFVDAVTMHANNGSWPDDYVHLENARKYRLRVTDLYVSDKKLPLPLSVAADRIAIPTMRAASLFAKITPRVPLDGSGLVCEVYPAAALARWGFMSRGYKGVAKSAKRVSLIEEFSKRTSSWLTFDENQKAECARNDNLFDALIAALVSRCAQAGLTESIPDDLRDAASREGWIAIPREGSLAELINHPSTATDVTNRGSH
jgi:hypothetical protein